MIPRSPMGVSMRRRGHPCVLLARVNRGLRARVGLVAVLDKIVPFVLVLGLSSLALAGPPARAHRGAPARAKPATAGQTHGQHDDRFRAVKLELASGAAQPGPVTIFVNGEGATLRGGFEDAAANSSSIVDAAGLTTLALPAYADGAGSWASVMGCVAEQFEDFEVQITDRRPQTEDYIMIMVGGSPADIGEHSGVAGIAPYTGSIVYGAVGFVFSEVHGGDTRGLCETIAHEAGHTLGLDHTHACADTMSYLYCGDKSFVDAPMSCGEWDVRQCGGGAPSQNSHATLAASLGRRAAPDEGTAPQVEPEPSRPTPEDEFWAQDGSWDDLEREQWLVWVDGEWVEWSEWPGWIEGAGGGEVWVDEFEGEQWEQWETGSGGCSGS